MAGLDEDDATPREERRVITVRFADLVGFTERAETLDPEDVRALLTTYYRELRSELERRARGAPGDPERADALDRAAREEARSMGLALPPPMPAEGSTGP